MKLNEDSNERKEGVEEYEENLPEKCDYCNSEIWELYPQKLIRCEDPNFEEVKTNSIATFNYICEDCCTERILQGDCEGLTCNHFKDKYPDIRISKVEEKLNKYNIPYEIIDGNILSKVSRFPQWGYFFSKLPSDLSSIQELIEDNFIITLNSGHKTKLQISGEEQNWFVEIELIDFFKEDFWFETSNYYISTKEIEEDGEKIKIKYLIIKYSNSHGNLPPEYLIVQMHSNYGSNYSNSEFIYDPHQIKIKKKKN